MFESPRQHHSPQNEGQFTALFFCPHFNGQVTDIFFGVEIAPDLRYFGVDAVIGNTLSQAKLLRNRTKYGFFSGTYYQSFQSVNF